MGLTHSPKIVTDGLVFYVDAANGRSYPGTGTACTDLKNGLEGTLQNGAAFSSNNAGIFAFDGTNDQIVFTDNISINEGTFVAWLKRDGSHSNYNAIVFSRGDGGGTTGMNFYSGTNNISFHWNNTQFNVNSGLTPPVGEWCMAAVTVSSSAFVIYLYQSSGFSKYSGSGTHNATSLNSVTIGGDSNYGGRNFNGDIGIAQIYNRALTEDEVRQNYEATVGRYT